MNRRSTTSVLGRAALALLALAALSLPADSTAFDSRTAGTPPLSDQPYGREAARKMYSAEHTPLMEAILQGSGIPNAHVPTSSSEYWNAPHSLWVPTLDTALTGYSSSLQPYTVVPSELEELLRLREREFIPTMFAELPDFSYTLADWVTGNELCPPNLAGGMGASPGDSCYEFKGWMGSLNSTHFPPQATTNHWYYDQVSREIADQCKDYQSDMGYAANSAGPIDTFLVNTLDCGDDGLCPGDDGYPGADAGELDGLDDFLVQCQGLSLMFEAIAQHFLQDAWSSGHMWQRWGGPMPADIISKERGMAVAMASGIIHGAKAISYQNDRMCAGSEWRYAWGAAGRVTPGGNMTFVNPSTTIVTDPAAYTSAGIYEGLGDLFLPEVQAGGGTVWSECLPLTWNTAYQKGKLYDCATMSARQTYEAGPMIFGGTSSYSSTVPDTDDDRCLSARATTKRMYHGSRLDTYVPLPDLSFPWIPSCYMDFDNWLIWGALSYVSSPSLGEIALLKAEMVRIKATLFAGRWASADSFDSSTNTGTWKLGSMMGIAENGGHNTVPAFADPMPPWDGTDGVDAAGDPIPDPDELALLTAFNRSNTEYWCHRDNMGFEKLNTLRRRCQGIGVYSTLDAEAQEANCQTCEEFSSRHIRIGCSDTDSTYTTDTIDRQPVCALAADPDDVDFLYLDIDPTDPMSQDAGLAAANYCRSSSPSFGPCVNLTLIGDYDTTYCSVVYYPWYICMGCSSCLPIGQIYTTIDSPYEEEDLNWNWTFSGGYVSQLDNLDSPFVFDILTPYTCGVTVTGSASVSLQVWDPYYASWGIDFDTATASCYGY